MSEQLEAAAALLRAAGWSVLPPPSEAIPDPVAGQVWRSPSPRIEPRTVVSIGQNRRQHWVGGQWVLFTTPKQPPHPEWGPSCLRLETWRAWARKSGARPDLTP